MTGDGVNDAPAVKAADIGIVRGIEGTDVTKEAAGMVLTDDNFASIVNAVEEGRGIYDNIQKFLHFLLASNMSEVLFMFCATLLGWPVPLIPIQILWINLVTNGLPALALAMEPLERDLMQRKPRAACEPVLSWERSLQILFHGSLMGAVTLVAFGLVFRESTDNLPLARTVAFAVLTLSQIAYSIGCRSQTRTMPQLGAFTNPSLFVAMLSSGMLQLSIMTLAFARPIFAIADGLRSYWGLVILLSLIPVTIIELLKIIRPIRNKQPDVDQAILRSEVAHND